MSSEIGLGLLAIIFLYSEIVWLGLIFTFLYIIDSSNKDNPLKNINKRGKK